jgi:LuxR family transcriptional regulator, maltose regulon positive regulatory protein
VLLSALAVALDRIGPVDPAIFSALASSGADISVVPRFVSAIAPVQPPVTVLLDHAEAIASRQCLNTIAEFALRLPPGWQLALASRAELPLPTARLRAEGGILEVTADDLAMGPLDAAHLLKGAGAEVDEAALHDLLQRTEGWSTGLYIAALAMNSGTPHSDVGFTFTGDDVFMGDYLRSELLDRVSGAEALFLTRTSVLDRMCGPLCDAILAERDPGVSSNRLKPGTCWWSRSTAAANGIATTTCSGSCCRRNSGGGSPIWLRTSISGRLCGSRRTPCRRPRSSMPRRPGITTG